MKVLLSSKGKICKTFCDMILFDHEIYTTSLTVQIGRERLAGQTEGGGQFKGHCGQAEERPGWCAERDC